MEGLKFDSTLWTQIFLRAIFFSKEEEKRYFVSTPLCRSFLGYAIFFFFKMRI